VQSWLITMKLRISISIKDGVVVLYEQKQTWFIPGGEAATNGF
jgi:hypothetical protein